MVEKEEEEEEVGGGWRYLYLTARRSMQMFNGPFGGDLSHLVVSALLTALQLRYWTTVVKYDRASSGHVIVFNGFSMKKCWRK